MKRVLEPEVMESIEEAKTFDEYQKKTMYYWWPYLFKKLKKLKIKSDAKILDVAAGPANFSIKLARTYRKSKVTATDLSNKMLQIARKNIRSARLQNRVKAIKDDAKKMRFKSNSFDFVFFRYSLHQIAKPLSALNEVWRVTKLGGKIFIYDLLRPKNRKESERLLKSAKKSYKKYKIYRWKSLHKASAESLAAGLSKTEIKALLRKSKIRNSKLKFEGVRKFDAFLIIATKNG